MKNVPILAIYDNLIGYKNLHIAQNEAVAVRGFTNSIRAVLESGDYSEVSPTDLSLWCVGRFCMDDGSIEVCEPHALIHGTAIVTQWHIDKFDSSDMELPVQPKVGEVNGDN